MFVNPLTKRERQFWEMRRQGKKLVEIGRITNSTRQNVYQILRRADQRLASEFEAQARSYKIELLSVDPDKGIMTGFSHALGDPVVVTYSPDNGVQLWYRYRGQCDGCSYKEQCLEIIKREAKRLGVTFTADDLYAQPAKLAERVFRDAWQEAEEMEGEGALE